MARRIRSVLIDDLDGSKATETVRFALYGASYEIDLNIAHAQEFRRSLERYAQAGRLAQAPRRRRVDYIKAANGTPGPAEVREWAKASRIEVRDRGPVSSELIVKFKSAADS